MSSSKLRNLFFVVLFAALAGCLSDRDPDLSQSLSVETTEGQLTIYVLKADIIRVSFQPTGFTSAAESFVVNRDWEPVDYAVAETDGAIEITTQALILTIDRDTAAVRFATRDGQILLQEAGRALTPTVVAEESVYHAQQEWHLSTESGIYGLGQHQDGVMNFRNEEVTLVQTNTVAVNPFLVSTDGFGLLWDNPSKTVFRDSDEGASFWSEVADHIDYYFFFGDDIDAVISGYREATGVAPMLGKWAYGYWQSKERYRTADELLSVAREYRERRIPIDNIVQDWAYWADYREGDEIGTWESAGANWSSLAFHPSTYPDPSSVIEELHDDLNMHFMVSIWPAVGPDTAVFKALEQRGHLYPPVHWSSGRIYDAFSAEARDIYWRHLKAGLLSHGVDALWMDGTEPELGDQHLVSVSEANIKSFGVTAKGSMARNLNAYSLMTTTGAYERFREEVPGKRFFTLTRSAFAGQQRNAAATWSGDINARFDVMRDQISSGINFSMAGIPYWTADIGAFFIEGNDKGKGPGLYPKGHSDPSYRELYVRWFQFGAFLPIFRAHGTATPREVWRFGEVGDWGYETLVKFIELRYRLMPYIYSSAWRVTSDGYTLMRGLPMDFSNDPTTFSIDNQYLFGPSIMVTPVTEHQYHPLDADADMGEPEVSVYLPSGKTWFDFWTGQQHDGGQYIVKKTPIDILPLYVPAGSIIPLGPLKQWATEKEEDPIELRIYPGADADFVLYEDDGETYDYETGAFATIPIHWDDGRQQLSFGSRSGSFPGMLKSREFQIVLVGTDEMDSELEPPQRRSIVYSGTAQTVSLTKR